MRSDLQTLETAPNPTDPISLDVESINGRSIHTSWIHPNDVLAIYLKEISRFPILTQEQVRTLTTEVRTGILRIQKELLTIPSYLDFVQQRLLYHADEQTTGYLKQYLGKLPNIGEARYAECKNKRAFLNKFSHDVQTVKEALVFLEKNSEIQLFTAGDYRRSYAIFAAQIKKLKSLVDLALGTDSPQNSLDREEAIQSIRKLHIGKDSSPPATLSAFIDEMVKWEYSNRMRLEDVLECADRIATLESSISEAKSLLFHSHLRQVHFALCHPKVKYWIANSSAKIPYIDILQEGNIGLLEAIDGFEAERGNVQFATYAHQNIWRRARDYLRDHKNIVHVPRSEEPNAKLLNEHVEDLLRNFATELSPASRAAIKSLYGIYREDARNSIKLCTNNTDCLESEEDWGPIDLLLAKEDVVEDAFQLERRTFILGVIEKLWERPRRALTMYYGLDGEAPMTLLKIGKELNCSEALVCDTLKRVKKFLQESLKIYDQGSAHSSLDLNTASKNQSRRKATA